MGDTLFVIGVFVYTLFVTWVVIGILMAISALGSHKRNPERAGLPSREWKPVVSEEIKAALFTRLLMEGAKRWR